MKQNDKPVTLSVDVKHLKGKRGRCVAKAIKHYKLQSEEIDNKLIVYFPDDWSTSQCDTFQKDYEDTLFWKKDVTKSEVTA